MHVHLAARNELEVLTSLVHLLCMEIGMGKAIHLAVISERPAIEAILNAEVDVLLRISKPIERGESRVGMEAEELGWSSILHFFLLVGYATLYYRVV